MPFSIPRALVAYPACNPLIKLVAGHYASLSQREGFSSQFSTCHRYTVFGGPAGLASLHGAGFLNPRHGPWADPFFGRPTGAGASPLGRGRLPPDRPWRSGSDTLHSPRGARSFLILRSWPALQTRPQATPCKNPRGVDGCPIILLPVH